MLLSMVKYWHLYVTVCFWYIGRHIAQNEHRQETWHIRKMSVNRASTCVGCVSWVIWGVTGYTHSYTKYWLQLYPKEEAKRSLLQLENELQLSINNFWWCDLGDQNTDRLQNVINGLFASIEAKRENDTLPTTSWKWVWKERQWLLVLHLRQYAWRLIISIHTEGYGSLGWQICTGYSHHILRDSNNLFHFQRYYYLFLSLLAYINSQNDEYRP